MSATAATRPAWREATLGEILPLKYGKARSEQFGYPRPETSTFGSNGVFGMFARALTRGPSILVGRKGAAGTVHYSAEPCWPIDTTFYTEGHNGAFLPFFRYMLESLQLVQLDRSTAIPSLSRDDYNSKIIRFPEALPEQRRIVAEVEKQFTRLEAGVAALRRVQANLKRYRAAVLKAACAGKLVPTEYELAKAEGRIKKGENMRSKPADSTSSFFLPPSSFESGEALLARILTERRKKWQGRGQYKEPAAPDTINLLPLPDGWAVASVDQISGHITSGSRDWSQFYDRGTGTFILAQNVRPMRLDLSERQSVDAPKGDAETERTRVRKNDILVTIVGAKTGDVCRVPIELQDHFVCQSVALLRPMLSGYAKFAEMYLASQENGQAQWKRYIYGQGRPHLSFEQLRMTAIPLPPLAEQTRIVAEVERRLSVLEELDAMVSANLQRATRLRQSVLQKAFVGKLTDL